MKKLLILFAIFISLTACNNLSNNENSGIVVTSPEAAEIVAELAGIDNIIGRAKECNFPQSINNIELVGQFGEISVEKIIKLKPEIVFTASMEQADITKKLEKMGIKTVVVSINSIEDYRKNVLKLGKILDKEAEAEKLLNKLKTQLAQLKTSEKSQPKVYVEIYGNPIMTVSNNSFVGKLISEAEGMNIFPKLPREYCRVSQEDIIKADPEIIILTYPGVSKEDVKKRMGWSKISAVKNDKIYTTEDINPDLLLRAGPRFIQGIKELNKAFYE